MNKVRFSTKRQKILKIPNRNDRAEEYKNWTAKFYLEGFNIRIDQAEERTNKLTDKQWNSSNQRSNKKKRMKKSEDSW